MAKMGKYIYCFIKEKNNMTFMNSELANLNAPVYNIVYNDVSAIVSDAPMMDYDPARKNLLAHQHVIIKIMETYSAVPVAFGTVANNKKDVEDLISAYYDEFMEALVYLKDRVELGLRVAWNKNYFNEDIETPEITALKNKIAGKAEQEVFKDKIYLGQLVEASINSKRDEYKEKIFNTLSTASVESKQSDKIAVKTVFNAYFLVDKVNENDFDKKVEAIAENYKGKLDFMYTGPWPPYNFVDISMEMG